MQKPKKHEGAAVGNHPANRFQQKRKEVEGEMGGGGGKKKEAELDAGGERATGPFGRAKKPKLTPPKPESYPRRELISKPNIDGN